MNGPNFSTRSIAERLKQSSTENRSPATSAIPASHAALNSKNSRNSRLALINTDLIYEFLKRHIEISPAEWVNCPNRLTYYAAEEDLYSLYQRWEWGQNRVPISKTELHTTIKKFLPHAILHEGCFRDGQRGNDWTGFRITNRNPLKNDEQPYLK